MTRTSKLLIGLPLAIAGAFAATFARAAAERPATPDIAILTPAVPATIEFHHSPLLGQILPMIEPVTLAASVLTAPMAKADAIDTGRLNSRATADGYSPAASLSVVLVEAFQATARSASAAKVERTAHGGPGPIRLSELPDDSLAPVLLDVSVTHLKLSGAGLPSSTRRLLRPIGSSVREEGSFGRAARFGHSTDRPRTRPVPMTRRSSASNRTPAASSPISRTSMRRCRAYGSALTSYFWHLQTASPPTRLPMHTEPGPRGRLATTSLGCSDSPIRA